MRLVTKNKYISSSEQVELSTNHQKLIDATIETIAKRGLGETTISHVSQAAKVSQGYANFRFKSKENLLLSSLKFISDEYKKSWGKIFEEQNISPEERVLKIIENDFSSKIACFGIYFMVNFPKSGKPEKGQTAENSFVS